MSWSRRAPLRRTTGLAARGRVNQVSRKRQAENRQRRKVLVALLVEDPMCRRCRVNWATEGHEPLKRSRGGSITDPANVRPSCRECNEWAEREPKLAEDEGWLIPSWGNTEPG